VNVINSVTAGLECNKLRARGAPHVANRAI